MARQLRRAVLPGITGGVMYTNDVFSIEPNQAYIIRNCHLLPGGVATTRNGSRILNASTALSGAITSIYQYNYPDGPDMKSTVLVTAGKTLYRWDESTSAFVSIAALSVSDRPSWATFTNGSNVSHAFMCNGKDFIKYNGSTVSNVCASDSLYPWLNCAPRYIVEYDDRLMVSGCDSDPYKVFVSKALDGTNWLPGTGSAAQYWTAKGSKGDKVRGLSTVYNYGVIAQERSISIITEADPDSTTSEQILVNSEYGTTSHWSMLSVGNALYFADSNHIYRGVLRNAIENGLLISHISDSVGPKYESMSNHYDTISVYDSSAREIWWCADSPTFGRKDTALVYSVELSSDTTESPDRFVWCGWFDSPQFCPNALGLVIMSDGSHRIWRGDDAGYVYVMGEDNYWKDQYPSGGVAANANYVTEIVLPPMAPVGITLMKMARQFTPTITQKYNGSAQLQCVVDGTYIDPPTDQYGTLSNHIPYWRATTNTNETQEWNNTVWSDNPYVPISLSMFSPFKYIQFRILCPGTNDRDSISYNGAELLYQLYGVRHTSG